MDEDEQDVSPYISQILRGRATVCLYQIANEKGDVIFENMAEEYFSGKMRKQTSQFTV